MIYQCRMILNVYLNQEALIWLYLSSIFVLLEHLSVQNQNSLEENIFQLQLLDTFFEFKKRIKKCFQTIKSILNYQKASSGFKKSKAIPTIKFIPWQ